MLRRDFLKGAMAQFVTPASAPIPGIIEIGSIKQTFLDDLLIFEASHVSSIMARPRKYAKNPILVSDQPWEQSGGAQDYGVELGAQSILYDEDEKLFKMWYIVNRGSGEDLTKGRNWCYAVSSDGYHWDKPKLGLFEFNGSRENNLIWGKEWGGGDAYANVIKDPADPDPKRLYKALGFTWSKTGAKPGLIVAFSPDGIRWTEHAGNPVTPLGRDIADVPSMLGWDPKIGKYVLYPRLGHPQAPEIYGHGDHRHIRSYGYASSSDFVHWSPTRPMLTPDREDRNDYQYMQLTAGIDGEFYIGFNAMYETHEQTWDIFLMSSRDGFHWNWIDGKVPFLGRSEYPGYDAGFMTPAGPIFHGDQVWIYYGAFSGAHSFNPSKLGPVIMTVALCQLPRNRWRGFMAGPHRGTIVTRPMIFQGSKLMVDIEAGLSMEKPRNPPRYDECEFRAALEDQSGGGIEGFTMGRSKVLRTSGEQEMTWEGGEVAKLAGKAIRIRFEFHSAALYSLQFI